MDYLNLALQTGGTIAAVGLFVTYLIQADKQSKKDSEDQRKEFNKTVDNFLEAMEKQRKEFTKSLDDQRKEFVKSSSEQNKVITSLKQEIEKLSNVIKDLYNNLLKKTRKMEENGIDPNV